jgi:molybdate-binding protein
VVAGSHDPLLDWAIKESDCGLALLTGGSLDGLERLGAGEAVVAGLHLLDGETGDYNVPAVTRALPSQDFVLIEWAWRTQGLVVAAGNPRGIETLADLKAGAVPVIRRQEAAGSQLLLAHLLERDGLALDELDIVTETARSETDLGLAILEGRAAAGLAVEAVARGLKLGFVPLLRERYDLLLRRRDYFEPPLQKLLTFALSEAFRTRAEQMGGYDVTGLGQVRYNGP